MKNETKATAAAGGVGVLTTWAAIEISRRTGVPAEAASVVVGGIFAFVARWAAKLIPTP